MSNLLWQCAIPNTGKDITVAGSIYGPNKIVLQNTSSRTVYVACGVGASMPNIDQVGAYGTGFSSNCIVLFAGATSPVITLPAGGSLLAITDTDSSLGSHIASLNIFQES